MNSNIDYAALVEEHKDLIEAMAWVAFTKIRRPSYDLDDLIQEGRIVCIEWVQRWYRPGKGASLKTFITAGLRNHFADLVRKSFREHPTDLEVHETDLRKRSSECGPEEMAIFNETYWNKLTEQQRRYITLILQNVTTGPSFREHIRTTMGITITVEEGLRKGIRIKLSSKY